MKTRNTYEILEKLIGPIVPVGETHTDEKRYENLEEAIEVAEQLIGEIYGVSRDAHSHMASMKKSGDKAANFMLGLEDYLS